MKDSTIKIIALASFFFVVLNFICPKPIMAQGGGPIIISPGEKCISNPWLGKFLGVHENGQLVMWPRCSGGGEKWDIQSNGCIFNPWLNKYLGVHENGQLVMWPRC